MSERKGSHLWRKFAYCSFHLLSDKCDAFFWSFIKKCCLCTSWKKWRPFFFFLDIHYKWLMKHIFVENGCILGKFIRAPKFILMLTELFGHLPTCKNLRGNTGHCCDLIIITLCEIIFLLSFVILLTCCALFHHLCAGNVNIHHSSFKGTWIMLHCQRNKYSIASAFCWCSESYNMDHVALPTQQIQHCFCILLMFWIIQHVVSSSNGSFTLHSDK